MKNIMLWFFIFYTFTITTVYSANNVTLPKINSDQVKDTSLKESPAKEWHNKTKTGSLEPITRPLPLNLMDNNITVNLLSLDQEMPNTKEKPIHPRKGVEIPLDNIIPIPKNLSNIDNNILNANIFTNTSSSINKTNQLNTTNILTTKNNIPANNVTVKATTLPVKKPLVLSYEAISRQDDSNHQAKMPMMKSSLESIVHDQIPSPNKDSNIKTSAAVGTRDPGMITPIVITILVVPMFAVLGYMALRRGQEAWKNRHYKRMDFLLDGMYND